MCFFSTPSYSQPAQPQVVTVPGASDTPEVSEPPAVKDPATTTTNNTTQIIEKSETPQEQDKDVAETRRRERKRLAERRSANDTLVTGGAGLSSQASTGTKELLGA